MSSGDLWFPSSKVVDLAQHATEHCRSPYACHQHATAADRRAT
ncbi:hypothetical protein [Nocardia xishanensis]|uniref:Uncharacterized protein n=1 Tax=Nocardia xishanensis TaxID=238964 RepID=A0ABW7XC16_9NOCA